MEPGSAAGSVLVEVVAQILREPFFDQLRTKQQLGYLVFSGTRTDDSITFLRFILQVRGRVVCVRAALSACRDVLAPRRLSSYPRSMQP